jgi:regulator of nucleoside diphosphate kinase
MPIPELTISVEDHHRLLVLCMTGRDLDANAADDLFHKLERMRIVPDRKIPADVVCMGSDVRYQAGSGPARQVRLVYPAQADISRGRISVVTPVGTALLGLRQGHSAQWRDRAGREHVFTVLAVLQPEQVG